MIKTLFLKNFIRFKQFLAKMNDKKFQKGLKMRIKAPHAAYIARKISLELLKCGYATFKNGTEPVADVAAKILLDDINAERALEERTNELMDANENDIEFMQVDRRTMFGMIKKKLAAQTGFILEHDERYSRISHEILEAIWQKDLMEYNVSENKMKNVIYGAIESYIKNFAKAEAAAFEQLEKREKKLIPGSEQYDLEYEKAYEEQLKKHGII